MCRGFIRLYLNYQRYSYTNLQLFAFYSYLHIYFSLHSVLSFFLLLVAFIFSLPCTEPLTLLQHPNCHRGSKQFYFLPLTRWLLCQRLRFKTLPTALPVFALIQQQSFALLSSLCCEDVKLCQSWHCPSLATDTRLHIALTVIRKRRLAVFCVSFLPFSFCFSLLFVVIKTAWKSAFNWDQHSAKPQKLWYMEINWWRE